MFVSLVVGFAVTAAVGLLLVGAFNLISIAFAVLFVGLGADFGIQYAVRYRAERHEIGEASAALHGAARKAGGPLALGRGRRPRSGSSAFCRPTIAASPSSARSPASAC